MNILKNILIKESKEMKGMTLSKLFLGLFLACIMQGCAFNDYEGTAQRAALANICEQEGFVSYREFAYYNSFQLGEYAHQNMQKVDDNKLNSMYLNEVEKFKRYNLKSPESRANLRTTCANVAVVAERVRPKNSYQGQQQSVTDSLNQMGSSAYQSGNQALQQVNTYPPPTVKSDIASSDVDLLSEKQVIYRGLSNLEYSSKKHGQSWTLCPSIARRFAKDTYSDKPEGIVVKATVNKKDIIYYDNNNCEKEIIVKYGCIAKVTKI